MKKKILCLLLILIIPVCLLFTGCGTEHAPSYEENTNRFIVVYSQKGIQVYVDKETRVMYLFVKKEDYSAAGLTIMLNEDGTPMIYEGEL